MLIGVNNCLMSFMPSVVRRDLFNDFIYSITSLCFVSSDIVQLLVYCLLRFCRCCIGTYDRLSLAKL
jgi:hypothetical protein